MYLPKHFYPTKHLVLLFLGLVFLYPSLSAQEVLNTDSIFVTENGYSFQKVPVLKENIPLLKKALELEKKSGSAYYNGQYDLHTKYGLEALNIFDSLKLINKKTYLMGMIGYCAKRRNLKKAFNYMQNAMALFPYFKNIETKSGIYNNYGVLHYMAGNMDSALYFHKKSLLLDELSKDTLGLPYALNYMALVYIEIKNFSAAQNCLNRALKIRQLKNYTVGIAENYNYQARLEIAKGNYQAAIKFNKKALDLSHEMNYPYWIQVCSQSISECYEKLNNNQEALFYYKQYTNYKDSIVNNKSQQTIANLEVQYETLEMEKKISQQALDLLEASEKIKRQYIISIAALIIVALIISWGIYFYKTQQYKRKKIQERAQLKTEIAEAKVEVEKQNERIQIAKELHDNIGAQLTFVISSIDNMLYQSKTGKTETFGERLFDLSKFTRKTITQLRDTIWLMNKPDVKFSELESRVSEYIASTKSLGINTHIKLSTNYSKDAIIPKGNNVYRVIQEALNNALKYANSTSIEIKLSIEENKLLGSITDNGTGFHVSTKKDGFGLTNMNDRIELLGGTFTLLSTIEKGTKIAFTIPLKPTDAV